MRESSLTANDAKTTTKEEVNDKETKNYAKTSKKRPSSLLFSRPGCFLPFLLLSFICVIRGKLFSCRSPEDKVAIPPVLNAIADLTDICEDIRGSNGPKHEIIGPRRFTGTTGPTVLAGASHTPSKSPDPVQKWMIC